MKKLLFATAIAASAAAFADPINAISFESYNNGDPIPGENGRSESNEIGTGPFFYFQGGSNSSIVTNDAEATFTKHTAYYSTATDKKYLALDTEGGTLWRLLDTIGSVTDQEGGTNIYSFCEAQTVPATGIYLDTLVQFTVTEDDAPSVGEGDKLAIWLQADNGTTNLMVKANYWAAVNEDPVATTFTVAGVSIEPGAWYRLTVKAIPSITTQGAPFPAFQIFIDGTAVAATTAQYDEDFQNVASSRYATGIGDLIAANKLFPTLAERPSSLEDVTLQGVGFQGTGAVDEIVWTEEDLFPAAPTAVDFTLTWGEGVSSVSYVLSTDLTATNSLTSGTAVQLAPGDGTATIELIPTFASGYEFDKVAMGETELGLTFAIPGVTTNATLLAKAAAAEYPTYIDTTDTAIKTQYDTWKTTNGADSESAYEKQFLLNVAPATTVADDALQIDSITENATAGWDIVVSTTVTGAALSDGSKTTYNGYLLVKSADTLAGLASATPVAYPVTAVTGGKVSITVTSGKFMKVELTTTAPAQN